MGFFNFFKKSKEEPEINYDEITEKAWEIFRTGFINPDPAVRLLAEEAVYSLDTPEGKRFFAAGVQEPDIRNQLFVLKKLYERGGWRLAENFLNMAYDLDNELTIPEREELIYFTGSFSDPDAFTFLEQGITHSELKLRIAVIAAIAGVKNGQGLKPVKIHLQNVTDNLEKFVCGLSMYQFNDMEGKKIIDEIFNPETITPDYAAKFRFLDLNKALPYLEKIADKGSGPVKKEIALMIKDNRGIQLLKKLIRDKDPEVSDIAVEQAREYGLSSVLPELKEAAVNSQKPEKMKAAMAVLGDREARAEFEAFLGKAGNLSPKDVNVENLKVLAEINEQHISEILGKLLLPVNELDGLPDEEIKKINEVVKILIKYGKLDSVTLLSRYCEQKYPESHNLLKWEAACNAAAAVLCITERNRSFIRTRER